MADGQDALPAERKLKVALLGLGWQLVQIDLTAWPEAMQLPPAKQDRLRQVIAKVDRVDFGAFLVWHVDAQKQVETGGRLMQYMVRLTQVQPSCCVAPTSVLSHSLSIEQRFSAMSSMANKGRHLRIVSSVGLFLACNTCRRTQLAERRTSALPG